MKKLLVSAFMLLFATSALADHLLRPSNALRDPLYGQNFSATELTFSPATAVASGATTPRYIQAVRLMCSATCYIGIAATAWDASATGRVNAASGLVLVGGETEYFADRGGSFIIVIGVSDAGILYVRTMTR